MASTIPVKIEFTYAPPHPRPFYHFIKKNLEIK